ncbi:MAG TPA: hypothetical protein VN522_14585 [Solirubrobacterales bacterium]|nr:hypothetical protein [Solirubrobacterales bacterium]
MTRALTSGVLVLLAVFAAGFIAQRLFGSDSDPWTSEAREAIEALPYGVSMSEGSNGILTGTIQGHLGVVVDFTVNESGASESPGGSRTDSRAQRQERADIGTAIEEALCRKSIGKGCPP